MKRLNRMNRKTGNIEINAAVNMKVGNTDRDRHVTQCMHE